MDVSNSTGEGTGYRVVGGGGIPPGANRIREGLVVYEADGRKYVRVENSTLWHEVLAEGTLEPYTYVTVKPRKKIHAVVFHRNEKPLCTRDVTGASSAKAAAAPPSELLVSLMQNGKSTAETCLCRWKKA